MWTDSDYELLTEWLAERELRCPRCGTRRDDWLDGEHPHHEPHYFAEMDECLGCTALGRISEQNRKTDDSRPGDRPILVVNPAWDGDDWG